MPANKLFPTSNFKKHFKKVKKNSRWIPIFKKSSRYEGTDLSAWEFIIDCLIFGTPIPEYFYAHPLTVSNKLTRQIKAAVGNSTVDIQVLDLHFDGHNGDHLLVYCVITSAETVVLIDIGTHADLFE